MQELLEERGPSVVFFGRLAAFPSTLDGGRRRGVGSAAA